MPLEASAAGFGDAPSVASVVTAGLSAVIVTFSEEMADDAELRDASNYSLTPYDSRTARTVLGAAPVDGRADQVLLALSGPLDTGSPAYAVTVALAPADTAGNILTTPADADLDVLPTALDVPDHCALGLARLIAQYRDKAGMRAVVCILGDRLTEIDQAAQNVRAYRGLDGAYGAQLDALGEVLQLRRNGVSDGRYAQRLHGAALARGSHGRPDELIGILQVLAAGTTSVLEHEEHFPGVVLMRSDGDTAREDGRSAAQSLRSAVVAGVRLILEHSADETLFGFDEDPSAGPWGELDADTTPAWAEASGGE